MTNEMKHKWHNENSSFLTRHSSLAAMKLLVLLAFGTVSVGAQAPPPDGRPAPAGLYTAPLDAALRTEIETVLKTRNYSRAEELLESELEKNPGSPQLLTLLGGTFFLDGKYLNCAIAMKRADALTPLDERSRFTLAMSYVSLKRSDWARPELEKLAAGSPQNALYTYWIARLDYDASQYPAAIAALQRALRLDPGFVRAHDNLGLCYEALGKYAEAIESFKEAVRLNRQAPRGSPWPPLNLALLLSKLGHMQEVEAYLKESLRYEPGFAQAHYQLGVLLEKRQKPSEAIEELDRAADLDPSYAEPHYALARIYRRMGERETADKSLATFLKLKSQEAKK